MRTIAEKNLALRNIHGEQIRHITPKADRQENDYKKKLRWSLTLLTLYEERVKEKT